VETDLRQVGGFYSVFFYSSSQNARVKEFLETVLVCQSCHKKSVWFLIRSTYVYSPIRYYLGILVPNLHCLSAFVALAGPTNQVNIEVVVSICGCQLCRPFLLFGATNYMIIRNYLIEQLVVILTLS